MGLIGELPKEYLLPYKSVILVVLLPTSVTLGVLSNLEELSQFLYNTKATKTRSVNSFVSTDDIKTFMKGVIDSELFECISEEMENHIKATKSYFKVMCTSRDTNESVKNRGPHDTRLLLNTQSMTHRMLNIEETRSVTEMITKYAERLLNSNIDDCTKMLALEIRKAYCRGLPIFLCDRSGGLLSYILSMSSKMLRYVLEDPYIPIETTILFNL